MIKADEILQRVFDSQENIHNTEALLSAFLDIPFNELKGRIFVKSKDMNNLTIFSKQSEKDIVLWVDTSTPLKITIEMNKFSTSYSTINRNLFFASDIFSSSIKSGTPYDNLIKTIQLNFNPRFIDKDNCPVIDKYTFKNDYSHELTKKFALYQINLTELYNLWYNKDINEVNNIKPLAILFGALIMENEKDKFKKLLNNKLLDKDIKTSIERIVFDMNKDTFVVRHHYDS